MGIKWEFVFPHHFTFLVPIAGFLEERRKKNPANWIVSSVP